jgi:hypothetical protein
VIHLIENLGTFRIAAVRAQCHSVLELPVRAIYTSQTQIGDELLICTAVEMEIHWKAEQNRKLQRQEDLPQHIGAVRCGSTEE